MTLHARHFRRLFGVSLSILVVTATCGRAATYTVTNSADSGSGTLRASLANAGNGDTITFSLALPASITLTSGQLLVSNNVTIVGPGSNDLCINGNAASRVFDVTNNVSISGLTVSNGAAGSGGGIYNSGSLLLSNCVITRNSAGFGGGVYSTGSLTVVGGTFVNNSATETGGGIDDQGQLSLLTSTVSSNSSGLFGGGISIYHSTALISRSTLNDNSVPLSGGGGALNGPGGGAIYNDGATVQLATCTISGNQGASGGGICDNGFDSPSGLIISACTFDNNFAVFGGSSIYNYGGGLHNVAVVQIADTILNAGATSLNIYNDDEVITGGYNLCSDGGGGVLTNVTDQIDVDAILAPLQNNGGPTLTCALLNGSPAIDKGRRNCIPNLALNIDQRGLTRPVVSTNIAKPPGGDGSDIGAFEVQAPVAGVPLVLTGLQKLGNGSFQFSFTNTPGAIFSVYATTNLATVFKNWLAIGSPTEISSGHFQFTDQGATNSLHRFYRVTSP